MSSKKVSQMTEKADGRMVRISLALLASPKELLKLLCLSEGVARAVI